MKGCCIQAQHVINETDQVVECFHSPKTNYAVLAGHEYALSSNYLRCKCQVRLMAHAITKSGNSKHDMKLELKQASEQHSLLLQLDSKP